MKNKIYNVEFTAHEIEAGIKKIFTKEYNNVMPEVIMGLLDDDPHKLNTLMRASLHIIPKVDYSIGDLILVDPNNLNSWRFNMDETIDANKYTLRGLVKAKIVKVNLYKLYQYDIEFYGMLDGVEVKVAQDIYARYIEGYQEVIPDELLKTIETETST